MPHNQVPLKELAAAVQNAVQQTLGKHGAVPIDQLWVGFVAPENIATLENANLVARELGREAHVHVQAQLGTQIAAPPAGAQAPATHAAGAGSTTAGASRPDITKPGHLIGLVYSPQNIKQ
jgi:hypothetical protein